MDKSDPRLSMGGHSCAGHTFIDHSPRRSVLCCIWIDVAPCRGPGAVGACSPSAQTSPSSFCDRQPCSLSPKHLRANTFCREALSSFEQKAKDTAAAINCVSATAAVQAACDTHGPVPASKPRLSFREALLALQHPPRSRRDSASGAARTSVCRVWLATLGWRPVAGSRHQPLTADGISSKSTKATHARLSLQQRKEAGLREHAMRVTLSVTGTWSSPGCPSSEAAPRLAWSLPQAQPHL